MEPELALATGRDKVKARAKTLLMPTIMEFVTLMKPFKKSN
jgi:hypothetical protein